MVNRHTITAALWAAGLYISGLIIPILGQAAALFAPVPLIIAIVRRGRREGLAALAVSFAIVALITGVSAAALFLLGFGLMALGTSEGMLRQYKPEQAALLGGLLPVAALALGVLAYYAKIGTSPVAALEESLRTMLAQAAQAYRSVGLQEPAELVTALADKITYYAVRLMPTLVVTTSVVQAACCYGLARVLIIRKDGSFPGSVQTPFSAWHAPDGWVWGLIASLALLVVPSPAGKILGWNATLFFAAVYVIQGLTVVEYYLKKVSVPSVGRGLILSLVLLIMPLLILVIALGAVDIWGDFRKIRGGEETASS